MKARPWLAAAASGLLLAAAFPPLAWWPLAWAGLAPLWLAVRAAPDARAAADLGGLCGFVFAGAALPWLVKVFGPWAPALWCLFGLGPALHAFLIKRLQARWGAAAAPWLWCAAAGVLWAGMEAGRARLPGLECSWLGLGYSQAACLPLLQGASVLGVLGLSAAAAAFNAALALAVEGERLPALVLTAALGVGWALGERRLEAPPAGRPLSVALVQDESFDLGALAALTRRPAARDADLVVWPEYQVAVPPGRDAETRADVQRAVGARRGVLVVGAASIPDDPRARMENFAWALGPDGRLLGRYDKEHPIPFMERRLRGGGDPRPVATPLGPLGVQVCYDLDFEEGARRLARRGAGLLVVPDEDPAEWGAAQHAQHSAMAAPRAVESGLWVARAASSGQSELVDARGRVRARLVSGTGVLAGTARLGGRPTPYVAWGWLFGPLCLAALGAVVLDALAAWARGRALTAYPRAGYPSPVSGGAA